ncbi:MAG: hypothetical protein H6734_17525 [Alphaproteobacteria bacterium]|nr:hypothetical protein [Alphaproteobacteria bacterium]
MIARIALVAVGLAVMVGCTPKKLMLNEQFVPGHAKTVRESIKTVGSTKEETLNNYYLQVCDVDAGVAKNCKTTLVLENVVNYDVQTGWSLK